MVWFRSNRFSMWVSLAFGFASLIGSGVDGQSLRLRGSEVNGALPSCLSTAGAEAPFRDIASILQSDGIKDRVAPAGFQEFARELNVALNGGISPETLKALHLPHTHSPSGSTDRGPEIQLFDFKLDGFLSVASKSTAIDPTLFDYWLPFPAKNEPFAYRILLSFLERLNPELVQYGNQYLGPPELMPVQNPRILIPYLKRFNLSPSQFSNPSRADLMKIRDMVLVLAYEKFQMRAFLLRLAQSREQATGVDLHNDAFVDAVKRLSLEELRFILSTLEFSYYSPQDSLSVSKELLSDSLPIRFLDTFLSDFGFRHHDDLENATDIALYQIERLRGIAEEADPDLIKWYGRSLFELIARGDLIDPENIEKVIEEVRRSLILPASIAASDLDESLLKEFVSILRSGERVPRIVAALEKADFLGRAEAKSHAIAAEIATQYELSDDERKTLAEFDFKFLTALQSLSRRYPNQESKRFIINLEKYEKKENGFLEDKGPFVNTLKLTIQKARELKQLEADAMKKAEDPKYSFTPKEVDKLKKALSDYEEFRQFFVVEMDERIRQKTAWLARFFPANHFPNRARFFETAPEHEIAQFYSDFLKRARDTIYPKLTEYFLIHRESVPNSKGWMRGPNGDLERRTDAPLYLDSIGEALLEELNFDQVGLNGERTPPVGFAQARTASPKPHPKDERYESVFGRRNERSTEAERSEYANNLERLLWLGVPYIGDANWGIEGAIAADRAERKEVSDLRKRNAIDFEILNLKTQEFSVSDAYVATRKAVIEAVNGEEVAQKLIVPTFVSETEFKTLLEVVARQSESDPVLKREVDAIRAELKEKPFSLELFDSLLSEHARFRTRFFAVKSALGRGPTFIRNGARYQADPELLRFMGLQLMKAAKNLPAPLRFYHWLDEDLESKINQFAPALHRFNAHVANENDIETVLKFVEKIYDVHDPGTLGLDFGESLYGELSERKKLIQAIAVANEARRDQFFDRLVQLKQPIEQHLRRHPLPNEAQEKRDVSSGSESTESPNEKFQADAARLLGELLQKKSKDGDQFKSEDEKILDALLELFRHLEAGPQFKIDEELLRLLSSMASNPDQINRFEDRFKDVMDRVLSPESSRRVVDLLRGDSLLQSEFVSFLFKREVDSILEANAVLGGERKVRPPTNLEHHLNALTQYVLLRKQFRDFGVDMASIVSPRLSQKSFDQERTRSWKENHELAQTLQHQQELAILDGIDKVVANVKDGVQHIVVDFALKGIPLLAYSWGETFVSGFTQLALQNLDRVAGTDLAAQHVLWMGGTPQPDAAGRPVIPSAGFLSDALRDVSILNNDPAWLESDGAFKARLFIDSAALALPLARGAQAYRIGEKGLSRLLGSPPAKAADIGADAFAAASPLGGTISWATSRGINEYARRYGLDLAERYGRYGGWDRLGAMAWRISRDSFIMSGIELTADATVNVEAYNKAMNRQETSWSERMGSGIFWNALGRSFVHNLTAFGTFSAIGKNLGRVSPTSALAWHSVMGLDLSRKVSQQAALAVQQYQSDSDRAKWKNTLIMNGFNFYFASNIVRGIVSPRVPHRSFFDPKFWQEGFLPSRPTRPDWWNEFYNPPIASRVDAFNPDRQPWYSLQRWIHVAPEYSPYNPLKYLPPHQNIYSSTWRHLAYTMSVRAEREGYPFSEPPKFTTGQDSYNPNQPPYSGRSGEIRKRKNRLFSNRFRARLAEQGRYDELTLLQQALDMIHVVREGIYRRPTEREALVKEFIKQMMDAFRYEYANQRPRGRVAPTEAEMKAYEELVALIVQTVRRPNSFTQSEAFLGDLMRRLTALDQAAFN